MAEKHSTLTDPELHEPKGISTASANTVYVAGGSGTGAWGKIDISSINSASASNKDVLVADGSGGASFITDNSQNKLAQTVQGPDPSATVSEYVVIPVNCKIFKIYNVIDGTLGTADTTLSFKKLGGSDFGNGDIVITASGSSAGDVEESTPTSNNTFSAGDVLVMSSDGAGTGTLNSTITLLLDLS